MGRWIRPPSPAQLVVWQAAIDDYARKYHAYKLEQAALLRRVTAMFDAREDKTPAEIVVIDTVDPPTSPSCGVVPSYAVIENDCVALDESSQGLVNDKLPQVLVEAVAENNIVETNCPSKNHSQKLNIVVAGYVSLQESQESIFHVVAKEEITFRTVSPSMSFVGDTNPIKSNAHNVCFCDFHLEDKVYFNRRGVDTNIYDIFIYLMYELS